MYKVLALFVGSVLLIVGCSAHELKSNQSNQLKQSNTVTSSSTTKTAVNEKETVNIDDLAQTIYDTNDLYYKKILDQNSPLSKEEIQSITSLIQAKTKDVMTKYNQLSNVKSTDNEMLSALKNACDKLQTMNVILNQYSGDIEGKKNIYEGWKIVNNYWKTYYEMSKGRK